MMSERKGQKEEVEMGESEVVWLGHQEVSGLKPSGMTTTSVLMRISHCCKCYHLLYCISDMGKLTTPEEDHKASAGCGNRG